MPVSLPVALDRPTALRFLQRCTFGPSAGDVGHLLGIGVDGWLDEQVRTTPVQTHFNRFSRGAGLALCVWQAYLSDADQLRKRLSYALSQIFVVSRFGAQDADVAVYADLLEANCFGTYRDLLGKISRSPAMADYLSFARSKKANSSGSQPDENYAREILQLFSIGLWHLNPDGTRRTDSVGQPIPTYGQDDIAGLARVFTGMKVPDFANGADRRATMITTGEHADRHHERGEKMFLGSTIPASGTRTLEQSLDLALDVIAGHPNVGPFIGRQLIQRLVTSNPSSQYVRRVAEVFDDDGSNQHVRGNLLAVLRAVLFDPAAWVDGPAASFGKVREPVLRFTALSRAMGVGATGFPWPINELVAEVRGIGQQPFFATSVFNFYRPGYVPPNTELADAGLVSPEMQLTTETSVVGFINFMAQFFRWPPRITTGSGSQIRESRTTFAVDDLAALVDGKTLTPTRAHDLLDELERRLVPQGLAPSTREIIVRRLVEITDKNYDASSTVGWKVALRHDIHMDRVFGAVLMIAASTEFLHER